MAAPVTSSTNNIAGSCSPILLEDGEVITVTGCPAADIPLAYLYIVGVPASSEGIIQLNKSVNVKPVQESATVFILDAVPIFSVKSIDVASS